MSRTIKIAPSILAADFTRLGEQIREAEAAGADVIHIDVMDGRFVPNITMGSFVVAAVRRVTKLPLDVHLMIVEPEQHLAAFAAAGADSINVHLETCPNLHRTLQTIKELNCRVGVAINPHSSAALLSEVMHMVDIVLVMTVNPGFGGQTFLPETLPKIAQLRQMANALGRQIDIGVDGGINPQIAPKVVEAGANVLIAGSDIFNAQHSVQAGIDALRGSVVDKSEL